MDYIVVCIKVYNVYFVYKYINVYKKGGNKVLKVI